ncbi:MAG: TorF family putative porin [Alphaproteobacteria bacterium]
MKPVTGPVSWDLGVIGYLYPGSDPSPTFDYVEFYAKPSITVAEGFTLGGALYYSPEFTGKTGTAYYLEANASYAATKELSFSGAFGFQQVSDLVFSDPASDDDHYTTWNVGATYTVSGFGLDLRYVGSDIDDASPSGLGGDFSDDRVVFTIKRAL